MPDKRIALVTGANQGVGLQVAKELVANGVTVVVGISSANPPVTARHQDLRYLRYQDALRGRLCSSL